MVEGLRAVSTPPARIGVIAVGPGYFAVMQAKPKRGRAFSATDGISGPPVAIVNDTFEARFWPGLDPLGQRVRLLDGPSQPWLTVVGLVQDILQNNRNPLQHDPLIYLPDSEQPLRSPYLVARTQVPPETLADAFRHEIQRVDEDLPVSDVRTLENHLSRNRLSAAVFGSILSVFAAVALLLASIGLYAVIAHAVSQRTQEIGVRKAIGGSTTDIFRLVLMQGMQPLLFGLLFGLPLAALAGRILRGVLVGVSPSDPIVLLGVILVLLAAGALGCAVPARRAIRVDPAVTLRQD